MKVPYEIRAIFGCMGVNELIHWSFPVMIGKSAVVYLLVTQEYV